MDTPFNPLKLPLFGVFIYNWNIFHKFSKWFFGVTLKTRFSTIAARLRIIKGWSIRFCTALLRHISKCLDSCLGLLSSEQLVRLQGGDPSTLWLACERLLIKCWERISKAANVNDLHGFHILCLWIFSLRNAYKITFSIKISDVDHYKNNLHMKTYTPMTFLTAFMLEYCKDAICKYFYSFGVYSQTF